MRWTSRAVEWIHNALYFGLIGLALLSLAAAASQLLGDGDLWLDFTAVYVALMIGYTCFVFALLCWDDQRPTDWEPYLGSKIAVLIPCFNEDPRLVEVAIRRVLLAHGEKQVIVIDDGSTNGVTDRLRELARVFRFTLHVFPENRGKRAAIHTAVTQLLDRDVRFVVTIDSDTVLERDALIKVVAPLRNRHVGAATGNVLLLNERQNLLTRMIGAYYWIGLNMYKQAQSRIRSVVCCSGCLAAYRADTLRTVIDAFASQRFLGEACTHSEDRHLTNLVLKQGLDVVYVPDAISWTETPATVRGFLRQQRRWKRGFIRESLFTLTHAWRRKKLLFVQVLCWDLTAPFLALGLRIVLIVTVVRSPWLFPVVILPGWLALTLIRYAYVPLRAARKLPGLLLYMVFYETVLYWLNIWALVTVRNASWVTRGASAQI